MAKPKRGEHRAGDVELGRAAQAGDAKALASLVERYRGLVVTRVRRFGRDRGIGEDLTQEGLLALVSAIQTWDPSRATLRLYATFTVVRALSDYICRTERVVAFPRGCERVPLGLAAEREKLRARGEEPTAERLAEILKARPTFVRDTAAILDAELAYLSGRGQRARAALAEMADHDDPESLLIAKQEIEHRLELGYDPEAARGGKYRPTPTRRNRQFEADPIQAEAFGKTLKIGQELDVWLAVTGGALYTAIAARYGVSRQAIHLQAARLRRRFAAFVSGAPRSDHSRRRKRLVADPVQVEAFARTLTVGREREVFIALINSMPPYGELASRYGVDRRAIVAQAYRLRRRFNEFVKSQPANSNGRADLAATAREETGTSLRRGVTNDRKCG